MKAIAFKYYDNIGYSLKTFEINSSEQAIDFEENYLGFELDKYHWWFVSFDEFDHKFYYKLEKYIKKFNKSQDVCNLYLDKETGGHSRRICRSDSDNYGTYYFLVKAKQKDQNNFTYKIPKKYESEIIVKDENKYGHDIEVEYISKNLVSFDDEKEKTKITIKFVSDDWYEKNQKPISYFNKIEFNKDKKKEKKYLSKLRDIDANANDDFGDFDMNYAIIVII